MRNSLLKPMSVVMKLNKLQMPLDVPPGFNELGIIEKGFICNGAGAKDGLKVPNTMWGLNCIDAFDIHDYDYYRGQNERDKRSADKRMLFNLTTIIVNHGGVMMWPRMCRATTYFVAVAFFGKKAFYFGKDSHGV